MKINENRKKSMKIYKNAYKFVKIDQKSMKLEEIDENHRVIKSSSFGARRQRRQPLNAPRQGSALPLEACQIPMSCANIMLTLC